jgi:hypothetical protein
MNRTELLQLHDETCKNARSIMEAKNNDYAGGKDASDPFANFKMAASIGVHPVTGLLLRMMDKIQRIRTFTADGGLAVSSESVDDACDDIVNYAILCKGLLREERASKDTKVIYVSHPSHSSEYPQSREPVCASCGNRCWLHGGCPATGAGL